MVVLWAAAGLGALIGLGALRLHLTMDPLADVHAYYDAGARLNAGLPLYVQPASTDAASFYRYPPLLAIAFRPLALLPFSAAAMLWELILLAATAVTIARIGLGKRSWLALGMLAIPILWTLAIGQAQALVTILLAFGTPFGVAAAGYLKLTPWLGAVYWLGRRDWRSLSRLAMWMLGLGMLQLLLAPQATLDYLGFSSLSQVGDVINLSPYAVSPLLWAVFVVVGFIAAFRLAPTRWGWAAAVTLSVAVSPRLLAYQLSSLLAALGGPREPDQSEPA
jgi:alpha-1,2-mannosyltransferase